MNFANGWTLTLRNGFIVFLKTAVAALIVNSTAWFILPANFNLITRDGLWNMGKLAGGVVLASELKVWIPKLFAWSQTPTSIAAAAAVAEVKKAAEAPKP